MPNDTVQVKDRYGHVVPVFKKNLPEAIRRGGTPVGVEAAKNQGPLPEDTSYLGNLRSSMGFEPKGGVGTDVKQIGEGLKDIATKPVASGKALGEAALQGQTDVGAKAVSELQSPDWMTKAHGLIREIYAGIPLLGPIMNKAGEQFEKGHFGAGLGTMTPTLVGETVKAPIVQRPLVRGAEAVTEGIKEAPPKVVQSVTGSKYTVNKAEKLANKAAQEKLSAYEKAKTERAQEVAEQKAAKEARDVKEAAQHKAATTQELARARAKSTAETGEQIGKTRELAKKYKEQLAEKKQIEAENTKNEATKQVLTKQVESGSKQLTQNIKQTLDNVKSNFDAEYGDLDAKVFGKTPQNPKGTLQAELSPVAEAVQNAKKNLIEGTEESNKQFDSIMQRLGKDRVDLGGGELGIVPGEKISAADLRGYITEMERKVYDGNLLPDVRNAVKSVIESGKKELGSTIKKNFGETAVNAYKDLNSRYSDYLTDWRDTSTTNPLPKVRSKLLEGVAQNNPNYPVHLDIGRVLKGANAQKALVLLEKYKGYGADPKILADYNKALQQLAEIPNPKKVPEVAQPKYPSAPTVAKVNLPKAPDTEPFTPRGKEPAPPEAEPFNRKELMRNTIEERLSMFGRFGQGYKLLKMVSDAIHGNFSGSLSEAEQMALIEVVKQAMTSGKALDYFSREAEGNPKASAPPKTPPPRPAGPLGGINAQGMERSMRTNTPADLAQALHVEQQELMNRLRTAPEGAEKAKLVQRIVENAEMIREYERRGIQ